MLCLFSLCYVSFCVICNTFVIVYSFTVVLYVYFCDTMFLSMLYFCVFMYLFLQFFSLSLWFIVFVNVTCVVFHAMFVCFSPI